MLGTRTLRDRSTSHDPDVAQTTAAAKTDAKTKTQSKTTPGQWVEPSLAQQPSYKDHKGVSYYPGVSEHMQALGEAPLARVKARVKPDGARKSLLLGKGGGAAGGVEAQETPEGTPVPLQTAAQAAKETAENSRMVLVVDDENDADYAPTGAGSKKKERAARPRSAKLPPAAAAAATTGSVKPKITLTHAALNKNRVYDARKMLAVVDQAKMRANAAGKPDLAAAVEEIYQDSLKNARLTELLESILLQTANKTQLAEFHAYVRAAKRRIRDAKESKGSQRKQPDAAANGVAQSSPLLPVRTPSTKVTPVESENSALPSTERLAAQPAKAKISLKAGKSPSQRLHPRQSGSMSLSPSNNRKRAGSVDSDSSLTDLTSNPDDDDEEEDLTAAGTATMAHNSTTNGVTAKDHAAERGSLAAPKGNLKRSSAEADLQEEERERTLATKKQKMRESMVPVDEMYEESNVRGAATTASTSRLRSLRGKTGSASAATGLSITPNGLRRSARVGSPDPDSPLSDLSPMTSRETTPHVYRGPSKAFGKKAKTKQS
ncbi:hypothetical protein BDY17DRAFT_3397 [Neohortaea acidophila]|uniref:Uncharacterized protein n=1 Tax=Neohortaea acidophila TaxID=245834 RepID=A0A6A6Q562_9PEZI|nr:uncharacterized protein BDY17DRAFT_3397 [Neohortaea acidophila]KAF2487114.1 hypothetical protein BDY17DRAFT_3397 [Neohortaea acidophila]